MQHLPSLTAPGARLRRPPATPTADPSRPGQSESSRHDGPPRAGDLGRAARGVGRDGRSPTGVPPRGERAEAGQRVARASLRRRMLRGLPRQRGRDWPAAGRRRHARRRLDGAPRRRGDSALDALEHESRHRSAVDSARARGAARNTSRRTAAGAHPWTRLRGTLRQVLEATSVDDARDVYAAIRRAAPGGLGRADAPGCRR